MVLAGVLALAIAIAAGLAFTVRARRGKADRIQRALSAVLRRNGTLKAGRAGLTGMSVIREGEGSPAPEIEWSARADALSPVFVYYNAAGRGRVGFVWKSARQDPGRLQVHRYTRQQLAAGTEGVRGPLDKRYASWRSLVSIRSWPGGAGWGPYTGAVLAYADAYSTTEALIHDTGLMAALATSALTDDGVAFAYRDGVAALLVDPPLLEPAEALKRFTGYAVQVEAGLAAPLTAAPAPEGRRVETVHGVWMNKGGWFYGKTGDAADGMVIVEADRLVFASAHRRSASEAVMQASVERGGLRAGMAGGLVGTFVGAAVGSLAAGVIEASQLKKEAAEGSEYKFRFEFHRSAVRSAVMSGQRLRVSAATGDEDILAESMAMDRLQSAVSGFK